MAVAAICGIGVIAVKEWGASDPEGTGGAAERLLVALVPLVLVILVGYVIYSMIRSGVAQGIEDSKKNKG